MKALDLDTSQPVSRSAWSTAERVARESYGRLLALLAASTGDIEVAEDALGDAFERALRTWPERGVPDNPQAWLLTVARNRQRDALASLSSKARVSLHDDADVATAIVDHDVTDPDGIPDRRLALLFVCAHPSVEPAVRAPLMLQTVLGFESAQVARAFAVPASAMAQRLVRAKARIREARIPFDLPERSAMESRLDAVLEAVYGAYAIDWYIVSGTTTRASLAGEAHYLAMMVAELVGDSAEAFGLAALISFSLSRADARHAEQGFVPLDEQDTSAWDRTLVALGERYLRRAHALGRIGRFQLEAAIQSAHCARATSGATHWKAVHKLYAALVRMAPTLGARVALAAATGHAESPEAGLRALDGITDERVERFQPAWATRAHLLAEAGRVDEARVAYAKAMSLTTETAIREYLQRRASGL